MMVLSRSKNAASMATAASVGRSRRAQAGAGTECGGRSDPEGRSFRLTARDPSVSLSAPPLLHSPDLCRPLLRGASEGRGSAPPHALVPQGWLRYVRVRRRLL